MNTMSTGVMAGLMANGPVTLGRFGFGRVGPQSNGFDSVAQTSAGGRERGAFARFADGTRASRVGRQYLAGRELIERERIAV